MVECYSCGYEIDEDDNEFECPYCGEDDMGEGYYRCENCGALNTWAGDEWECENCRNEGITDKRRVVPYYDDDDDFFCFEDDEYCEDGIPDVNQGWVGEHYG